MLRILINLPIKRLVWTGHWSRPVLEFSKWQRTADWTAVVVLCGPMISGPVRSYDFRSWLVRVQSSPSLFPVLGPDFQTLMMRLNWERNSDHCAWQQFRSLVVAKYFCGW